MLDTSGHNIKRPETKIFLNTDFSEVLRLFVTPLVVAVIEIDIRIDGAMKIGGRVDAFIFCADCATFHARFLRGAIGKLLRRLSFRQICDIP